MNCKDFQFYASAYIDDMLSKKEQLDFKNHIEQCKTCNIYFENLKIVVESINIIEKVEVPINFSDELHTKLQNVEKNKPKKILFNKNIINSVAAALILLIISLSLTNNILNFNKKAGLYVETERNYVDNNEESTVYNITLDDSKEEAQNDVKNNVNEKEYIIKSKVIPANEMHIEDQKNIQENTTTQSNNKNFKSLINLFIILTLILSIIILIYKLWIK